MRFTYMPRGKPNSAFVSVLDRTGPGGAARDLERPRDRDEDQGERPRTDVYAAIDAMETAIKNELAAGPAAKPVEPGCRLGQRAAACHWRRPACVVVIIVVIAGERPRRRAEHERSPSPEVIQRSVRANMGTLP